MCDETCARIVGGVVGGIGAVVIICLAIFCFIRVSSDVRVLILAVIKLNFQIRKKRAQSGVYSPEEKENKDYNQRKVQLNTISSQLSSPEPERLI